VQKIQTASSTRAALPCTLSRSQAAPPCRQLHVMQHFDMEEEEHVNGLPHQSPGWHAHTQGTATLLSTMS